MGLWFVIANVEGMVPRNVRAVVHAEYTLSALEPTAIVEVAKAVKEALESSGQGHVAI